MLNEAHTSPRRREMPIRDLLAKLRHDGCGGRAGRVELLTGIEAACRATAKLSGQRHVGWPVWPASEWV